VADAARETGSSFERVLRTTIEQQPYTAVAIALGISWLLGGLIGRSKTRAVPPPHGKTGTHRANPGPKAAASKLLLPSIPRIAELRPHLGCRDRSVARRDGKIFAPRGGTLTGIENLSSYGPGGPISLMDVQCITT
jgi:hypothetical protein